MITKCRFLIAKSTHPHQNLAMEEYLTFHVEKEECILFLWQNQNTVVIGKNQNSWKECNVALLEKDGGHLVRRLSGGGAVFHDMGNLNFTFCLRKENYDVEKQLSVIVDAVNKLGLNAIRTGRNDITIEGQKISGNAFLESGDYCYHHGTILIDVDKEKMSKYLNVSKTKLMSKSVASVRSRVVNLSELYPNITIEMISELLCQAFATTYGCEVEELKTSRFIKEEIKELEKKFSSWEWNYGSKIPFQYEMERRFEWGDIQLQFHVEKGKIVEVCAHSDAMYQDIITVIPKVLKGCNYGKEDMIKTLRIIPVKQKQEENIIGDIADFIEANL